MLIRSIRSKVTLVLTAGLLVIFAIVTLINSRQQSQSLEKLYEDNSKAINWAMTRHIEDIMLNGENEKLQPLTSEITRAGILQNLTIIDHEQIVKRSSDSNSVGKPATDKHWAAIFAAKQDTAFTDEIDGLPVLVSYRIFHNSGDCQTCHDDPKQEILGGMKTVASQSEKKAAITAGFLTNTVLSIAGVTVLLVGITLVLNRQVFRPLKSVVGKLSLATQGDVDQTLVVKSQDEIGTMLKAIQNLLDYMGFFADASRRIASGDLRIDIQQRSDHDKLSQAYRAMLDNLRCIISQLGKSGSDLVSAAHDISLASKQITDGARNQSSQVTQVSSAIEEMTATIIETSKNSANVAEISRVASATASKGAAVMEETITGMRTIGNQVGDSARSIGHLSESAQKISEIIGVIGDIADQTNLLALNAAIEAARAGEQGRGFAVVADEVRKLADKTVKATATIEGMVKEIHAQTATAVSSMTRTVESVEAQTKLANRAGASLNELFGMVEQVNRTIKEIASAAGQQSAAAEEISRNIEQIAVVTNASTTTAQKANETSLELNQQAEHLITIVQKFKCDRQNAGV